MDYDLNDDDDPTGEVIFGKTITQEERMQADLKDHTLEGHRQRNSLYHEGRQAALDCSQEIRQQETG